MSNHIALKLVFAAAVSLVTCAACQVQSASSLERPEPPVTQPRVPTPVAGRTFYVSPHGRAWRSGRESEPMDLETLLSRATPAEPGDTILLRGGTYHGNFVSYLIGAPGRPIVVRAFPGERVTLESAVSGDDKVLKVNGSHTWYWDLELTSHGSKRRTRVAGCEETDRGFGLWVWGSNNKFINLVVHDLCAGFGLWGREVEGVIEGRDNEVYGSLVYYNGVEQTPQGRGQGHGIYVNNPEQSTRVLRENVVFGNFSQGIRFGDQPNINPVLIGNIVFQNGRHLPTIKGRNIYVGGIGTNGAPMTGLVMRENYTYFDAGAFNGEYEEGVNLGLWWPGGSGEITGNILAGGSEALRLGYDDHFTPTSCSGNEFYGPVNNYVKRQCRGDENTYHDLTRPSRNRIIVRPNEYERGRAHVVIYNWTQERVVSVDLTAAGLRPGEGFEIRDVWDYFGRPVVEGRYSGAPIAIPMTGLRAARMNGGDDIARHPGHSAPEFNVFVVLPINR